MKARRFIAFWDNLRLALGTLASNPLRSLLTLLGVVIGVTTVVTMSRMEAAVPGTMKSRLLRDGL